MKELRSWLVCLTVLAAVSGSNARTLNVPADYRTIQEAHDSAGVEDTVLVQPGVYRENLGFRHSVIGSLILTTGNPAYIDSTIIDGGGVEYGCVVRASGRGTMRGFTIRNGYQGYGGGLDIQSGSPVFEDLVVTGNRASSTGGGVYCTYGSNPTLRRIRISNNSACFGGGIGTRSWASPVIENCVIEENFARTGSALWSNQSAPELNHVLICHNQTGIGYGAVVMVGAPDDQVFLKNFTLVGNSSDSADVSCGLVFTTEEGQDAASVRIENSILWGNEGAEITLLAPRDSLGYLLHLQVAYCDVEGGVDSVVNEDHGRLSWQNGNLTDDPRFFDPENGDYNLLPDSPCIDAGSPNLGLDPDSTREDMGGLPTDLRRAVVAGQVIDAETRQPISDAAISLYTSAGRALSVRRSEEGRWRAQVYLYCDTLDVILAVRHPDYDPFLAFHRLIRGDSLWIGAALGFGRLEVSRDTILVEADSGASLTIPLLLRNTGFGSLYWSAATRFGGPLGYAVGSQRDSLNLAQITGDSFLFGATTDGERYYVSGMNGNQPNLIYVISREGELIDRLPQPDIGGVGMRDLEWDGELIWGGNDSVLCAVTREGVEAVDIRLSEGHSASCIAFDPAEGVLWLAGSGRAIFAYDQQGNFLGRQVEPHFFSLRGLGWDEHSPDGAKLIAVATVEGSTRGVYRINPATGETIHVCELENFESRTARGAAVVVDPMGTASLLTIKSGAPRCDQLMTYQLRRNENWFTVSPSEGTLNLRSETSLDLRLITMEEDDWAFRLGDYYGEVTINSSARGGGVSVPVHLSVRAPNAVQDDVVLPGVSAILATYPQPFNSTLRVGYRLDHSGGVKLSLVDLNGRDIGVVDQGYRDAGEHTVSSSIGQAPSGLYLLRLEADGAVNTAKVVLVK